MIRVGRELLLGEIYGYLEVLSLENLQITHTKKFADLGDIRDIIAI
jgi:hypothetical protein